MALFTGAAEKGAQKAAEGFANQAVTLVIDGIKKAFNEDQVRIEAVFDAYLDNASRRYNQIRTLAAGPDPRPIIGEDSLYEKISLSCRGEEIDTATLGPLLSISNNLLILGTGGAGKSMLMRYLFLTAVEAGDYIPVLVELRRVSQQEAGNISVEALILACLDEFDAELPREQFEYSLRLGKYLFLFDGFDEIRDSHALEAARKLQQFASKYPQNPCIITSRPLQSLLNPLETFTHLHTMPLSCDQAVSLAARIRQPDEKTREFCRQLRESLYEKHRDFAENPLLLSMMFLTFMRNNSIPDHLSDFYEKCYEALYSAHDTNDKGYFQRSFKYTGIDERGFRQVFAHFCFQTYFKEKYEFTKEEITGFLADSLRRFRHEDQRAHDYLLDLRHAVCLIVRDGDVYRFSHRSFQAYFAAYYTARELNDKQQVRLFDKLLSEENAPWFERQDYYRLLTQIEPERFAVNALKRGVQALVSAAEASGDAAEYLLRARYSEVSLRYIGDKLRVLSFAIIGDLNFNLSSLFMLYAKQVDKYFVVSDTDSLKNAQEAGEYLRKLFPNQGIEGKFVSFETIDRAPALTDADRAALYDILKRETSMQALYEGMKAWLADLDAREAALHKDNFFEEF